MATHADADLQIGRVQAELHQISQSSPIKKRRVGELERMNTIEIPDDDVELWPAHDMEKCLFPENACAIIIGQNQKQIVLDFIHSLNLDKSQDKTQDVTVRQSEKEVEKNLEASITRFTSKYDKLKTELFENMKKFSVNDLRKNTETKDEFDKFVLLRKHLSQTYRHGQNAMKQIENYKKKIDVDLVVVDVRFKHTIVPEYYESQYFSTISDLVKQTNKEALDKLIDLSEGEIFDLIPLLQESSDFIKAKALRTVTLSNKHLKDEKIHKRHRQNRPNAINRTQEYRARKQEQKRLREDRRDHTEDNNMTRRHYTQQNTQNRQQLRQDTERRDETTQDTQHQDTRDSDSNYRRNNEENTFVNKNYRTNRNRPFYRNRYDKRTHAKPSYYRRNDYYSDRSEYDTYSSYDEDYDSDKDYSRARQWRQRRGFNHRPRNRHLN